jgi:hypothetical protein
MCKRSVESIAHLLLLHCPISRERAMEFYIQHSWDLVGYAEWGYGIIRMLAEWS